MRTHVWIWVLLVALVVFAYGPSLDGGFLWDDTGHVTPPGLRGLDGLARIWTEPGAAQQYYPLLHTSFWFLHKVLGDEPFGYRLVNLALHLVSALLAWRVLERLRVPGSAFVAGLFLLHPVHVETVAWISELKNTLSGVFYLGALLAWVRHDDLGSAQAPVERERGLYLVALVLFCAALLTKTVTATWPAAVLVITWWRRGRVSWKRDVQPLVPFLAVGIGMAMVTVWAEHTLIGATGEDFTLAWSERLRIAGRAPWFYAWKLAWPVGLSFFYPHWALDTGWAWAWPVVLVAALAALLLARRRLGRGPLAAVLLFCGTLVPALGFFNVYPFRYSYAADHFQYLASLGLLTLFGSGAAMWCRTRGEGPRRVASVLAVLVLAALAWGTRQRAQAFVDEETLWRDTLAKNPTSAAAHNNLGQLLQASGRTGAAIEAYERSIELRPDDPAAYLNLGNTYGQLGRHEEALATIQEALERGPDRPNIWTSLANELFLMNRTEEAYDACKRALELGPRFAPAWYNLGAICFRLRRFDEGAAACRRAVEVAPPSAEPWHNLGLIEAARGRADAAERAFRHALELDGSHVPASVELARLLQARGELEQALSLLEEALALRADPGLGLWHAKLAMELYRSEVAADGFARVLALQPDNVEALARLAWIRATDARLADGDQAVRLAEAALEHAGEQPGLLNVLAAAAARAGDFERAVKLAARAEAGARTSGQVALANAIGARLALYREGRPATE